MFAKYFIAGFVSKSVASFDNIVTRVPAITLLTKTFKGRLAFSIGNILALILVVGLAWLFSSLLEKIPYTNIIIGSLILLLALAVYFDIFQSKKEEKIKKQRSKISKNISMEKFFNLIGLGFLISFIGLLDDFVVLTPLFLGPLKSQIYSIIGVFVSTAIQLVVIVYLAEKMSKIKYTKEIASFGLLVLAFLVYFKVF